LALVIIALLVPTDREKPQSEDWRADLKAILRRPVLLGLLTTVLGYAGVFTVFTFIAPSLTGITGFSDAAVSPILLVFGGGLVLGNLAGGKLADRNLLGALFGTLAALALVLGFMTYALENRIAAIAFVGLLGATGFATVAPLQIWVLQKADGVGESLASSFNIAAFNLGNAIGAWAGGMVIDHGPGLAYVPVVAAFFPLLAIAVSLIGVRLERPRTAAIAA
jgi:DHA1 family inner membrane transport protein